MPYKPTKKMQQTARSVLKSRAELPKSRRAGTPVGLARANQFAKGETVSLETVKRTYSYLSRALPVARKAGPNSKAAQAVKLWGGAEALAWSRRILKK